MDAAARQIEFVLNAEAGPLERQALLLCESIRQFGGVLSSSAITVVSPRGSRRPSDATLAKLDRLGAEYLALEIDSACPDYGPSFKVHAVAHVARRTGPSIVVQIDSDTVFVAEPPTLLLKHESAAARPVDLKGMCTTGARDGFDGYWRTLCALVGVDYERLPVIQTTVDRVKVRASYNGGLVVARRASGIFERTEEIFLRLVAAGLRPPHGKGFTVKSGAGIVGEAGSAYWGTSQAAFSLATIAGGHTVELLPDTYNFPLHCLDDMTMPVPTPLVHIHYHWLASGGKGDANALLDARLGLPAQTREWLRSRLPLGKTDLPTSPTG
jgi:hypothetical protein